MKQFGDAFKAALEKQTPQGKARLAIFTKELNSKLGPSEVWSYSCLDKDGPIPKISKAKAESYFKGRTLKDPRGCSLICCYVCPWACGCTRYMDVEGTVRIELPGLADNTCILSSGLPTGA